jgi:hypothetical protein
LEYARLIFPLIAHEISINIGSPLLFFPCSPLDDKSNDVQSVAVKCLAIILKKVHQTQVGEICEKLCGTSLLEMLGKPT